MSILTETQLAQYVAESYLLVSGLIPRDISVRAEAEMWRLLNASPDDPESWPPTPPHHQVFHSPELIAVYTPDFIAAAERLAGDPADTFKAPNNAYAINVFPEAGEWRWPHPHIDHSIKKDGHKTFPRAFRIAAMTFLSDVPRHGAGTVVWPGSHAQLEALAHGDRERYELMWTLNQALEEIALSNPIELTPKRGDVLFYSYLCAHSGSQNTSERVRLALNAKW